MRERQIDLAAKVLQNVAESALSRENAALENCYVNDVGGISNFPWLKPYASIPGNSEVYLYRKAFRDDLHCVSGGHTYRVSSNATVEDLTKVVVGGTGRPTFAETEDELIIAAGGGMVAVKGERTTLLSDQAPESTHVGFIDGYVVAIVKGTGSFSHSQPGAYDQWNPLDTFSAEGNPDKLTALVVSEYNELLLCGPQSIEQYESAPSGSSPFFRRWNLGTGVYAPYAVLPVDSRTWVVNKKQEWAGYTAQLGSNDSEDIQQYLQSIDNWEGAWAAEADGIGQRFIILQMPNATNLYGSKCVTLLFDTRKRRWSTLYGWDSAIGQPSGWQGRSLARIGGTVYVGGKGMIYTLEGNSGTMKQRMLWRSGHIEPGQGSALVGELKLRLERGNSGNDNGGRSYLISIRVNKDNKGFGRWVRKPFGFKGQRNMELRFPAVGTCRTVQFEIEVTDPVDVQIAKFWMMV